MSSNRRNLLGLFFLSSLLLGACQSADGLPPARDEAGLLRVVATTTLVGDVTAQVGGDHIDLTVLIPAGVDPHSFQPVPRDAAAVAGADLVLISGLDLETFMDGLLANAGDDVPVVSVSDGIEPLRLGEETGLHEGDYDDDDHGHGSADPHVWFDVANVMLWTENIRDALSRHDAENMAAYAGNAADYSARLEELDRWIQTEVARIPADRRQLVTDHAVLGYFAHRYSFDLIGAVIPAFSTAASPSAQEMAALQAAIKELGVPAIFVGATVNPATAEQVAADTGTTVVRLYTGSLSDPDGPAASYLNFMRYNVDAIVTALKP